MEENYGIYTTDGERLSGGLYDEAVTGLAEKLDESTASLFIRTEGTTVWLGAAVNVQKQGRRPDTFIYIEKSSWHGGIPPRIDLSYIHDFYARIAGRLSSMEYEIRDLASDTAFFGERRGRHVSGLSGTDVVEYALGKTLLCREVVCISDNLPKSVDFVVAIAEKLSPFLYAGFTIVVSKRSFKGADILVTESTAAKADIILGTESIQDTRWADIYRTAGIIPQSPGMAHWAAGRRTRGEIGKKLLEDLRKYMKASGTKASYLNSFIESEEIEKFPCDAPQVPPAPVQETGRKGPSPSEKDYGKWEVSEYDRMKLMEDYERVMEKKRKSRIKIIAAVAAVLVLAAAVVLLIAGPFGISLPGNGSPTPTPYITPSATIAPPEGNVTIERLAASPGNIPAGLMGVSSAYNITPDIPQTILIELSGEYDPALPYYLMKFNLSGYTWEYVTGTSEYSEDGAKVLIEEPGIYRIFTTREEKETGTPVTNTTGGA